MSDPAGDRASRIAHRAGVALLAAVAYLPALLSSPGRMPADTKLYLYLDPGGLLARAGSTFEPDQFAGWVPHQQIAYLWPSGPWYWVFDTLGVPDWIAHRLWIGTVLFLAGLGVRWVATTLGLVAPAPTVAGLVYQLSPFVLAYVSRTSLLLLPWAGLGWIVGLTIRATQRAQQARGAGVPTWRWRLLSWREPALIALIVATVGSINATALALVIPAPLLWLVHSCWQGSLTWRRAIGIALRVGAASLAVSVWWIAMLVVQSRHGADVLAFSETLEDVSRNSTGSEVLRSLGYWLFYQRNPIGPTTTASLPYLTNAPLILISFATMGVALVALVVVRWAHRRYATLLITTGAVLAVGVHPVASPSPLMSVLVGDDESGLALALRSSTRAMPVMLLGIALAIAAGVTALPDTRRFGPRLPSPRWFAAAGVVLLVLITVPAVRGAELVDPAIDRDEHPPEAWSTAASRVDERGDDGRVLQLPGAEFGAFRWGYTADQPLVGLADTPLVTRDLLPLGSAAAMDLLYALDDRFQDGVAEPLAVAAVARYLGVETVMLTNDIAFERYDTARPEIVDAILTDPIAPGLGEMERIGESGVNTPDVAMIDPTSLLDARIGAAIEPITLLAVDGAAGVHRAGSRTVVVSGSGDGLVDAAAAGLLTGDDVVRYSASLEGSDLAVALDAAAALVVTDSNRDRAHHWRSSQDVSGHTEPGGPEPDVLDPTNADQRLGVFPTDEPATQTVAVQDGPVRAIASSYGEPFAYRPEARAVMAIDDDVDTAWTVADHGDPIGERIRLELDDPLPAGTPLVLRQPEPRIGGRTISAVRVTVDDERSIDAALEPGAVTSGHSIVDPVLDGAKAIEIEITAVTTGEPALAASHDGVGFSEIDLGLDPTVEWIRVPVDAIEATQRDKSAADVPVAAVLTRLRVSPSDPWRSDPEPRLARIVHLPGVRDVDVDATLRIDARAPDATLAALFAPAFGDTPPALADRRLTGSLDAAGWAALDANPSTAWVTPFDGAIGATLLVPIGDAFDGDLTIIQPIGSYSTITRVAIGSADGSVEVDVPTPDEAGRSEIVVPPAAVLGETATLVLTITAIDASHTVDRRYGDVLTLPAGIAELDGAGLTPVNVDGSAPILADCDAGWLTIDGAGVPLSFATTVGDVLAGTPISAVACDGPVPLGDGDHRVEGATSQGLSLDRVVLDDGARSALAVGAAQIDVAVTRRDDRARDIVVDACPDGCWVILGEGFNGAWSASANTAGGARVDLGEPSLVDGGFNGWWLAPTASPTEVTIRWTAQAPVTWGLAVFALAAAALVAVVAVAHRPRAALGHEASGHAPVLAWNVAATPRRALAMGISLTVASGLLIQPLWALAGAAVGAATWGLARRGPSARLPEAVGVVVAGIVAVAVVVLARRDMPYPNAGWTETFDHLNGLALFALVCVAAGASFGDDSNPERRA